MNPTRRISVRRLPILLGAGLVLAAAPGAGRHRPAVEVEGRVAVRTGDPAPVPAAFGSRFESLAVSPDGLVFIDAGGSALFLKTGPEIRTLLYAGQALAGGEVIASLDEAAAGSDGTIAVLGNLADRRQCIVRIRPGLPEPEKVVLSGDTLDLREGAATVGVLYPPDVDPQGTVVASIAFVEGPGAIVRFPRDAPAQIVIESGDALGPGAFAAPLAAAAVSGTGRIAFGASLQTGESVVSTVVPGEDPILLVLFPFPFLPSSPTVAPIPPAINDAGQVAFLLIDHGALRTLRTGDGVTFIVAAPGLTSPGGVRFTEITEFPPAIDPGGRVLFGGVGANGRKGYYVSDGQITTLVEEGMTAGPAGTFVGVETHAPRAAASLGPDGAFHLAASATAASGIFSGLGGAFDLEVPSDRMVPQPRFASFLDTRLPSGGGGPSLAPGGLMLFDARVTGGARGLFVRDRAGAIRALVLDGDPAPGGGRFVGDRLAFHSINDAGTFAFLGQANPAGGPQTLSLFYGSVDAGPVRRVVDTELLPPGSGQPSSGTVDRVKASPSRLNSQGQIAVPVAQPDGTTVLMGYDGTSLFRIAGPGDPAPGGGAFTTAFTGSMFTGQPICPVLDDSGRVLFGAQTSSGDSALYSAGLAPGGGGIPARVLGAGDDVEGGTLSPFELQALDAGAAGEIAFQAIFDDGFDFADFVTRGGPASRLAGRFDPIPGRGFVLSVLPLVAVLDQGRVGYGVDLFDGSEIILIDDPVMGGGDRTILAASADPSPDGGAYLSFRAGRRTPGRLASDGRGSVALAAATTAGPEEIVLLGGSNAAPRADAGADIVAECAGPDGAEVALDGSGSDDADGDPLQYRWTWAGGEATGPNPAVTLPLGVAVVSLVVEDGESASAPDTIRVEVRDTSSPSITVVATPAVLWPPNGRLVDVTVGVQVSDRCDPAPGVVLSAVGSSEPATARAGSGIDGASPGTDDRRLSLRAERGGARQGRIYSLTYRATDGTGNAAEATTSVLVPHDQRH